MARIFFALEVPDNLRRQIIQLQQKVPVKAGDIKWVEENNLHLTLYFAGEVDAGTLQVLLAQAEKASAHLHPFTVTIKGMGAFPSVLQPRVLWLGIEEGRSEIASLARMLTLARDNQQKAFVPHLTIGRLRAGRKINVTSFLRQHHDHEVGSYHVTGFCCFQSRLTPQGPVYTKIREFFLS